MIVPAEGPIDAKICLIGEAPGRQEMEEGKPFVGPSGNLLMAILQKHGINRDEVRLTNVIKNQATIDPLRNIPREELETLINVFNEEIKETKANVFVPLGNTALYAMTGNTGMDNWRNSILTSSVNGAKTIATYHPAAALRNTALYNLILHDFIHIVKESESPLISLSKPELITFPALQVALTFLKRIKDENRTFAFDVETPRKPPFFVNCISFANSPDSAISINFFDENYWDREAFVAIYLAIKQLLEDPTIEKIGHNVAFDILALRQHDIYVSPPYADTMHKHHAIDPTAKHSLAFLCSVLTDQPFYKQWDHLNEAGGKANEDIKNLETYNAIDSLRTLECNQQLDKILSKRQSFYARHYQNLLPHLVEMFDYGLLINNHERQQLANEVKGEIFQKEKALADKLGLRAFNSNSPKQSKEVVYDILKCKPRLKKRGKAKDANRTLSTDEETLYVLYQTEPIDMLIDIIKARQDRKLLSFLEPTTKGAQAKRQGDIIRTEYKPMTRTGRLSSSASTATGIGLNLQNQPKKVRSIFIPRPGFIFLARDLPQAEAQVTAADAENIDLLHYFELSKGERGKPKQDKQYDIHKKNAAISLAKPQAQVTRLEREAYKRVVHGCLTGDHEVLTEAGWVRLDAYNFTTPIAVWNSTTKEITFEIPLAKTVHFWEGLIHHIHGRSVEAFCTPDHAFPTINQSTGKLKKSAAEALPLHDRIPTTGMLKGNRIVNETTIQLAVAIQADGSFNKFGAVRFSFHKQRKACRLRDILRKRGMSVTALDCYQIYLPAVLISDVLEFLSPKKDFNLQNILALDKPLRQLFLNELPHWDGSFSWKESGRQTVYFTTNKHNATVVQTVAHLTEKQALMREVPYNNVRNPMCKVVWKVSFNNRTLARISSMKRTIQPFAGVVYCVTTSTGFFMTRFEDKVFAIANTNYGMEAKRQQLTILKELTDDNGKPLWIPLKDVERRRQNYINSDPSILMRQERIREEVQKYRKLTTPFGRTITFHEVINDPEVFYCFGIRDYSEVFRSAYSFLPQSVVADMINLALVEINTALRAEGIGRVAAQIHDELLMEIKDDLTSIVRAIIISDEVMTRPVLIRGYPLQIFPDIKLGRHWGMEVDCELLDQVEEIYRRVKDAQHD